MPVIRDIMSKVVISIRPEATLMDAVKVLTKHHISGAPVVTRQGEVVGFISEPNLMDVLFDREVRLARVDDVMSREVYAVESQDPISLAAKLFTVYGVRRLPVLEYGRFIGVITRRDLLAHALHDSEVLDDPLMELIPSLGDFAFA
jgi:CBS domain-containing protein